MDQKKKTKNKNKPKIQVIKSKKFHSFERPGYNDNMTEISNDIKFYSCKNITNFVPRILPKKSFCKPSLFILNPDERYVKKLSSNQLDHNLIILSDSDSDENLSNLDSLGEEHLNKNEKLKEGINNEPSNEIIDNNSKKDTNSNSDNNINNENINSNSIDEEYNNGKYLSILDVLSMNSK